MGARLFVLAGVLAALGIVLLMVPASMTHVGHSGVVAGIVLRVGIACWVAAVGLAGAARLRRR